ncbi:MAG TPA: WecB/TagA/CpsF family glycosyltransferase [Chitinophagaceae bacterium]|nr:WecB/TagA/CpsF family glycosyltransferase [Chitinophagaceae bacterium]
MFEKIRVISLDIDHVSFRQSLEQVMQWALNRTPAYVCFANVHMTIEAHEDAGFRQNVNHANLVLADGKPLAVAGKLLYGKKQERIAGMDFMPAVLEKASQHKAKVFLYGSTRQVLDALEQKIRTDYPGVMLAGAISPPFRTLPSEELADHINLINNSGANLVLVSLGCPKQEKWMSANSHRINAVLLGVGGAFAVTAGLQKRSPVWMQKAGLEWLHRLMQEPKRLFKRYFVTNTRFIFLLTKEIIKRRFA